MITDAELSQLAGRLGRRLLAAQARLVTAESCTGGWIAKVVTDLAGSSLWFECGYVTYSNAAKNRELGVATATLEAHGAVSEAVVREMAAGALRVSGAEIAVAVSGIAGPDGAQPGKPVGTVWFCVAKRLADGVFGSSSLQRFDGNREAVRRLAVGHALELILGLELPSDGQLLTP